MTDRELMQMAIDALEQPSPIGGFDNQAYVAKALRDRLAQPEHVHAIDISQERVDETVKREHEPYGYLWFAHQMERRFTHYRPKEEQRIGEVTPLYTAPPKREWVGLTDAQVEEIAEYHGIDCLYETSRIDFYRAIEDKLKEKNT